MVFLEISQNSHENTCCRVLFIIKLQTLAQVFSCEFWEISNTNFFDRTSLVVASSISKARLFSNLFTEWKVFKFEVFPGPYFPAFGLNTERYFVFCPNVGKYGPENTPYLDTFLAVVGISGIHLIERSTIWLLSSYIIREKQTLSSRETSILILRWWYFSKSVLGVGFLTFKKEDNPLKLWQ